MSITVNGQAVTLPHAEASVADLLAQLDLAGKPVVVELNQRALFPRELGTTRLSAGDVVELVQITAGG